MDSRRTLRNRAKGLLETLPRSTRIAVKRSYYSRLIGTGRFQPKDEDLSMILGILEEGDWCVDVGANVGHYAIPMARRVGSRGRVIAIEPIAETFELLVSNAAAAGAENVTLLNLAISSAPLLVRMHVPRDRNGYRWRTRAHLSEGGEGTGVVALPLDRVLTGHPIRLVKIDAEGHESHVLEGMSEVLRRDLPILIVEDSPGHGIRLLGDLGYEGLQRAGSPNVIYAPEADLRLMRGKFEDEGIGMRVRRGEWTTESGSGALSNGSGP